MGVPEQVASPVRVCEQLRSIDRLGPLDAYQDELVVSIGRLLADGVDVVEITQAVGHVNDSLTRRLLALAESALGPRPCRYAWLSLGSHGRGEQVLSSDQDSALAYEDGYGGGGPDGAEDYFGQLAALVVHALARAGLPLCAGGYMATIWHQPIGDLQKLFRSWVENPEPSALLEAEVFLDVRPLHGDLPVEALDRVLLTGGDRGYFLVQMARAAVTFRPPLGLFGRLRTQDGGIDVKLAGIAAIVLLARLYALSAGSRERTTVRRLQAAADGGTLSGAGARDLTRAYRLLTELRLRHQLEQVRRGAPADNRLRLEELTAAQRREVREVLRNLRDVQQVTATRFATHTVT